MKKHLTKVKKGCIAVVMASLVFTTTVFATPTVGDLRDNNANAEAKLKTLQGEMTSVMTEINTIEKELVEVGQAVLEAEEDLKEAEERETEQYEAMKNRIVVMYENGNGSLLQKVLESGSLVEMLQEAENVSTLHQYDRKQLEEYVKTKEKIEKLKTSLEEDMADIQKEQKRLAAEKKELDGMIADLKGQVDDYEDRIQKAANAASNNKNNGSTYIPPVGTGGGSAIVAEAYKYLGVRYVWGGSSSNGVDCSGLVMLAHRAIGVNLPHYSGSQGSGGRAVSRAEAQPGDVVCYSGHVGIYIGGGQMIHAPEPGDFVKVVNVYGSPWFRRYW